MTRHDIEAILERQVRAWELRRKLAGDGGEAARDALAELRDGPWLSLSRQRGCGGLELVTELGRRLDWQIYDQEILGAIARNTHSRETVLSRLDEQAIRPFQEYIARLLVDDDPPQAAYLKEMTHVVWGLAKQGHSIIVGRGANWFLGPRDGLRLRVVAPLDQRVERVAAREAIPADEARRSIEKHDRARRDFIRQYFNHDIDDPLGYDLVLNLGSLSQHQAADIVETALRRKLKPEERD